MHTKNFARSARMAAAAAIAAVGLLAAQAQAATVTLSNITGAWFNPDPAAVITSNTGADTANAQIRWAASGYDFFSVGGASVAVPPSPSATFSVATFQHVNQPVGAAITAVSLRIMADIDVDGVTVGTRSFFFDFQHDETPNGDDPCIYGGANLTGVNINGCADRVSVSFSDASESFLIGSDEYTVNIIGFLDKGLLVTDFLTAELATNTAQLVANVTLRSDLTVPEPASLALVCLSLLALGLARRRA